MNASARAAARLIRERRNKKDRKRSIRTYVARVAESAAAEKAVTAALRTNAKKLRESGELGPVRTRVARVAPGVTGPTYKYTAAQLAMIASAYSPRRKDYQDVKAALVTL